MPLCLEFQLVENQANQLDELQRGLAEAPTLASFPSLWTLWASILMFTGQDYHGHFFLHQDFVGRSILTFTGQDHPSRLKVLSKEIMPVLVHQQDYPGRQTYPQVLTLIPTFFASPGLCRPQHPGRQTSGRGRLRSSGHEGVSARVP